MEYEDERSGPSSHITTRAEDGRIDDIGIRKLGTGLIDRAITDLKRCPISSTNYCNALEWLNRKDDKYVLSFENVCSFLGFDPDYIRNGIFNMDTIRKKLGNSGLLEQD